MKKTLLTILSLTVCANSFAMPANTNIDVEITEISDKRTTGKFFKGLELKTTISGESLESAKGITYFKVDNLRSSSGKKLYTNKSFCKSFDADLYSFKQIEEDQDNVELTLQNCKNPVRGDLTFDFSGSVGVYTPTADSVLYIDSYITKTGKSPIVSDMLKNNNVEITIMTQEQMAVEKEKLKAKKAAFKKKMKEQGLSHADARRQFGEEFAEVFTSMFNFSGMYGDPRKGLNVSVKDPELKIAYLEFLDSENETLKIVSRSANLTDKRYSYTLDNLPLETDKVAIYLITDGTLKNVPFDFKAVKLP